MSVNFIFGYQFESVTDFYEELRDRYISNDIIKELINPSDYDSGLDVSYYTINGSGKVSYATTDYDNETIDAIETLQGIIAITNFSKSASLKEVQAYYDAYNFFEDIIIESSSNYAYIGQPLFDDDYDSDTETTINDFKLTNDQSIALREIIEKSKSTTVPKLYVVFLN